jgi:hypothetical protein
MGNVKGVSMNETSSTTFLGMAGDGEPLLAAAGRVAVGPVTDRPIDDGGLSSVANRPFLLRFLEPIRAGKHDKMGATPPETTNPDGGSEGKEDFGLPDYEP